jgi:hypothetical protein
MLVLKAVAVRIYLVGGVQVGKVPTVSQSKSK